MLTHVVVLTLFALPSAYSGDYKNELLDPAWQDVLQAGGLHVGSGRAKRFVELEDNQPNIPYQECTLPSGKTGHCRHLRHCVQDDYMHDFTKFMDYLCIIKRTAVGACCPDNVADGPEGLAGDLPATASADETNEVLLKTVRAENRGCGISTRAQPKLMGSRPADPREWPWMASVTPEGVEQHCGGALITDQHVLTAAHCVQRYKAAELYVRLGEYNMQMSNESRTYNFRVIEKRQHKLFERANYHHDIALLKLHRPAVFNTYVWPICLPPPGIDYTGHNVVVVGWGTMWYGGPNSPVLMEVSVPVWQHRKCVDSFTEAIFEETICAGGPDGGKDACQGDSGGPLMYQMPSGRWAVVGVVSWGVRCGEPNHPGIYTRVDRYLGWIIQNARF